jgi:hypothetical protein
MALTACGSETAFRVPRLNSADRAHLACADYPDIRDALRALPAHVFLAGANGQAITTPDGHKWVRFDVANEREAIVVRFGAVEGSNAHFECFDDLLWLAKVWTDLEAKQD